jgi:methyltransferase-like protein/2-polyprenyl-3-methyl-5-hydroxy-6-metoxy-1,4-benzoquinol methylase
MSTITTNNNEKFDYDVIPYESCPYAKTDIAKMAAIGKVFGMDVSNLENARVLELGCCDGENILPYAEKYPKGHFTGVDLGKVQIDSALAKVKELKYKNIEFKHCSISDIDDSFGKFDYIICHGVFSWVPEEVREKIFDVIQKHLTPKGIAYISYNTLPGWNNVVALRDILRYHTKHISDVQEKLTQIKLLLEFMRDSFQDVDTPYAKAMLSEINMLMESKISYFMHDHLSTNNAFFYFSQFMEMASKYNLQYLADSSIASMYVGNMKPEVAKVLSQIQNIVQLEQYMDYLNNRRFRCTLLCHADVALDRNINQDKLKNISYAMNVKPFEAIGKDIVIKSKEVQNYTQPLKFCLNDNVEPTLLAENNLLAALLMIFNQNRGVALSWQDLVKMLKEQYFEGNEELANITLNLYINQLLLKDCLEIYSENTTPRNVNKEKPCVSSLVRLQAHNHMTDWVASVNHGKLIVNHLSKLMLQHMDGSKTQAQIIDGLIKDWKDKKYTLQSSGKTVEDEKEAKTILANVLTEFVEGLAATGNLM